jgi:NDP-sugar pyrophosphorylase family protein
LSHTSLIMPMAGRGSRFAKQGIPEPKPLIDLGGKPFFWWATESVRREISLAEMVFVVLEEHVRDWSIDARIHAFYPEAQILAIPEVTAGSAETADLGMAQLTGSGPVVINDCDHAFVARGLSRAIAGLEHTFAGTLMTFVSESPNYSFVKLTSDGSVGGTVEKQVASPFAIAGCYLFQSAALYREQYERYRNDCPYNELYISGIYNQLLRDNFKVDKVVLDDHFAFGTPEEYEAVQARLLHHLSLWLQA